MMRWIVASCLRVRVLVVLVLMSMTFVGFRQLSTMPVDILPEFNPPTVQIQTEALGLAAEEVEQLITVPLEQDLLNGVPWLDEIRSDSVAGLSSINLIFDPGTDVLRARQVVQERMTQAVALPHVSKAPVMIQPVSSTSRVMMVALSSENMSLIEMSVLARWRIKPRLMGVPGVANVSIWGQRERQLQVQVDPERLATSGVTLTQVLQTTGNALWVSPLTFVEASTPGTGGFVDTPNQRLTIQHVLPIRTARDLAQVRIEDSDAKPLLLGDVAQVVEGHQPLIGDAVVNDGPGLMLVVEKFPGASTQEVTRQVEASLKALAPGLAGTRMDTTVFRPASFIEAAIDNVGRTLLIGLLLLFLLFSLVLADWRAALIRLIAIVSSVAAAGLVLHARDATLNTVVLAALTVALGVIVDDAVVDTDTIKRRLQDHRRARQGHLPDGDRSTAAVITEAVIELRGPLVYATLMLVVSAVPLLFLGGTAGIFSRPLATSYLFAVLASMVVALTATPSLALILLRGRSLDRRAAPAVRWLGQGYGAAMSRVIRRPLAALVVAGVVVILGLALVPQLGGQSVLPSVRDRSLLIGWQGAAGMSRTELVRLTEQAGSELRAIAGVRNVGAHVGRAITSDQVVSVNSGELWATIDPAADYDATLADIRRTIDGYPGLGANVWTYPDHRVDEALSGTGDDVVVRIYGQDLDTLQGEAERVRHLLSGIKGVSSPRVDSQAPEPTVEIEVDLAAAQRHGIKPGDVRRDTAVLLSGLQAGNLFEQQKVFDVVVWGAPSVRHSLNSVRDLLLDTPNGGHVRLKDVAQVRIKPNPTVIKHDAVSRRVDVVADVRGRSVEAVVNDVRDGLKGLTFPIEYHAEVVGDPTAPADARIRLLGTSVAAAVVILLLLQAAFGRWRLACLLLVAFLVAPVGGVLTALGTGVGLSFGSLAGFFLVWGVAVRSGVLLISHYQRLERDEPGLDGRALVLRGSRERVAPIVLTAVAIAIGLLPALFLGGAAGGEVLHSLAVVALGGLFTSILFTLFIVPMLYLGFGSSHQPGSESATNSAAG
jgi:CzcA family heavy metal efflux pump